MAMRTLLLLALVGCGGQLVRDEAPDAMLDDATVAPPVDAGTRTHDAFVTADAGAMPGRDVRCPLRDGGYVICTAPSSYCCLRGEGNCVAPGSPGTEACVWIYCDGRGDCPDGTLCCERDHLGTVYGVACASPQYCQQFVSTHAQEVCVPDAPDDGCMGDASCTPSLDPLEGFWGVCGP
jgi:hypothetical protein